MSRPPDNDQRTLAWSTFDATVAVTAGAGTGKTRVLVDRYLAWVLAKGWQRNPEATAPRIVGSILAITFTEKAAGELQERIGSSLRALLGQDDHGLSGVEFGHVRSLVDELSQTFDVAPAVLCERAEAVLAQAHRMEVSTIHSFGARVLRQWPLEAGIHPEFVVDTDGALRRKAMRRAFVDATHAGLLSADGPRYARLLSGFGERPLLDLLMVMMESGFDATQLWPLPEVGRVMAVVSAVDARLREIRHRVKGAARGKLARVLQMLGKLIELLDRPGLSQNPRKVMNELDRARVEKIRDDLANFPPPTVGALFTPAVLEELTDLLGQIRTFCGELLHVDQHLFKEAATFYGALARGVGDRILKDGVLSFDDLLARTEALVTQRSDVARLLADRYGQILVDEFQDTNERQCRILSAIADAAPGARLFVVGDPKQSIYAFRGAELSAYEAFTRRLEVKLELKASFRTQRGLLDVMNGAFSRLFVPEPGLSPPPQSLTATRPAAAGISTRLWDAGGPADKRSAKEARQAEAQAIRRAILTWDAEGYDSGDRWSRFAVLSRVQSEASVIVDELEAAGIPCVVSGDKEFYRRQEVIDAANLLRVILDPADGLAWVGLLRSPIGGVPDRVLLDLARSGFFAAPEQAPALSRAEESVPETRAVHVRRVAQLCRVLDELRDALFDGPVDLWLELLCEKLPIPDLHATEYLGERKSANLLRVLEGFCSAAVAGTVPLSEWLDEVAHRLVGLEEESESALADETTDAVRIMSIHASKGLQFDHVLVPRLDWKRGGGPGGGTRADRGTDGWVLRAAGRTTWGAAAVDAARARVEAAEVIRLLYVACTRARESLTLMGRFRQANAESMAALVTSGFRPEAAPDRIEAQSIDTVYLEAPTQVEADHPELTEQHLHPRSFSKPVSLTPPTQADAEADPEAADFGTAVHTALESWVEVGAPESGILAAPKVAQIVREVAQSALGVRVRAADEAYPELPFIGVSAGTMDLLLNEGGCWTVVDYKTAEVRGSDLSVLAAAHAEQGRVYVRAVEEALDLSGVAFEIWFVRSQEAVVVDLDGMV